MSLSNKFKKAESHLLKNLKSSFKFLGNYFHKLGNSFKSASKEKYTIMFVPHSDRKVVNIKVSLVQLILAGTTLTTILVLFFVLGVFTSGVTRKLKGSEQDLALAQARINVFQDKTFELKKSFNDFESAFGSIRAIIGKETDSAETMRNLPGDLSGFISLEEQEENEMKEEKDLEQLNVYLQNSTAEIEDLSSTLTAHKILLQELPTLWPLSGNAGVITNYFGPAIEPFNRHWYLHRGIDIATARGYPVLATANGRVVEAQYHKDFGNYIVIKHNYGFYTQYAHLDAFYVSEGQTVVQGQHIGALGNTGYSTGPHVHYEIRIGTQLIDPLKFLYVQRKLKQK